MLATLVTTALARRGEAAWPRPLTVARSRGVVAADTREASQAGAELLARGGNAVDAAVAAALALGVASPAGSGLGGGGFLIYWSAKERKARALDFREVAPKAASRDMFLDLKNGGKADPEKSQRGGLAVAVPGEPAGLAALEEKFGKLGLAAAAAPAVKLARDGVVVYPRLAGEIARRLPLVFADDPLHARLAPSGRPLDVGDKLFAPELAHTLETLGSFYRGATARELVAAVQRHGGILTEADLAAYQPLWREPLVGHFDGYTVYAPPPPAGGATLIETLQILDQRGDLSPLGAGSSAAYHRIAEALRHAFADRARVLGDPAFSDVPTRRLVDPAYARELAARIADDRTQPARSYGSFQGARSIDPAHDHGTSHLCVVDGEGNAVALTTTNNLAFGAKFSAAGVVLNDQMDDFSAQPGAPNAFGLIGGDANAIAPGKRPVSSMTPTLLVKDGAVAMCAGGSGGPLIVSETAQVIVNVTRFGMDAEAAVSAPRIHAPWLPEAIYVEPEVPRDVRDGLERRGEKIVEPPQLLAAGAIQVVVVRPGQLEAASDPRKGGAPAAP